MEGYHWTGEELIAHLYGLGPDNGHLRECAFCAGRKEQMQAARHANDSAAAGLHEPGFDFLAAQRRGIYARISPSPANSPVHSAVKRFAPALAASLALAGGLFFFEEHRARPITVKLSDTQLVEDVGSVAMDPEPAPAAPLQALFED